MGGRRAGYSEIPVEFDMWPTLDFFLGLWKSGKWTLEMPQSGKPPIGDMGPQLGNLDQKSNTFWLKTGTEMKLNRKMVGPETDFDTCEGAWYSDMRPQLGNLDQKIEHFLVEHWNRNETEPKIGRS